MIQDTSEVMEVIEFEDGKPIVRLARIENGQLTTSTAPYLLLVGLDASKGNFVSYGRDHYAFVNHGSI